MWSVDVKIDLSTGLNFVILEKYWGLIIVSTLIHKAKIHIR
jgi:hypothetical protein